MRPARKPHERYLCFITAVLLNELDRLLLQGTVRLSGATYTVGSARRAGPLFVCRGRGLIGPRAATWGRPYGNASFSGVRPPVGIPNQEAAAGRPPNHDPTKWSWFGEEEQGNAATNTRQGVQSGMDFATTRPAGPLLVVSRRPANKSQELN